MAEGDAFNMMMITIWWTVSMSPIIMFGIAVTSNIITKAINHTTLMGMEHITTYRNVCIAGTALSVGVCYKSYKLWDSGYARQRYGDKGELIAAGLCFTSSAAFVYSFTGLCGATYKMHIK